jgi:hypothetical protein
MIHCCLCRKRPEVGKVILEPTDLPGTGYRCVDRAACRARVREIVAAHQGLGEVCR